MKLLLYKIDQWIEKKSYEIVVIEISIAITILLIWGLSRII